VEGAHGAATLMSRQVAVRSLLRYADDAESRWQGSPDQDLVAVESPLTVRIQPPDADALSLGLFMRTPGHDEDLALGALFAEGVIQSHTQVRGLRTTMAPPGAETGDAIVVDVTSDADISAVSGRGSTATSACGLCGRLEVLTLDDSAALAAGTNTALVTAATLSRLPERLRAAQAAFAETGGLHAAGVFTAGGDLRILREDVGRHNAVDKVAGAMLREGSLPAAGHVLVVSGRVAYEIVQKAARCGIPVILAVGAPTDLAVDAARSAGITLAGFARENRFNVYTWPDRVEP
jgi:FdhD protein